jgi:hypothetical protein
MRVIEDGAEKVIGVSLSDHERREIWKFKQRYVR